MLYGGKISNQTLPTLIETEGTYIRNVSAGDDHLIYDAVLEFFEQFKIWFPMG